MAVKLASKATGGHPGGGKSFSQLATYLTASLVICFAMASWSQDSRAEARYYPPSRNYFESRLSQLYYTLSSRINKLQEIVHLLAKQECQTGTVDFSICPGFKEESTGIISTCVTSPIAGAGINVTDVTVTFAHPFKRTPIVGVSYSGLAILNGKNCTLEVINVQSNQITIRQVADDLLPVASQATFYACPSAVFDKHSYK